MAIELFLNHIIGFIHYYSYHNFQCSSLKYINTFLVYPRKGYGSTPENGSMIYNLKQPTVNEFKSHENLLPIICIHLIFKVFMDSYNPYLFLRRHVAVSSKDMIVCTAFHI